MGTVNIFCILTCQVKKYTERKEITMQPILGSHVGMSGKDMMLGSVKEALSYNADTFMLYTGAPQNTKRKEITQLNITPAWECMREGGIE